MILVVRNLAKFDGRSSFSTWVYRIATNASLDELRRKRRRPIVGLASPTGDDGGSIDHADPAAGAHLDAIPDRMSIDRALATLPEHPNSLPINDLMPIPGTPLGNSEAVDPLEFVRMIAVARIVCPKTVVRLSAGREHMSRELQALCFLAGANSMFIGGKLLTTANPDKDTDAALMADLGLRPMTMAAN